MIQTIKLYQTVRYSELRTSPIFAKEKTWLGAGYYFWEHEIENAHHWGETHYHNRYTIYQSSYKNTEDGIDLVDNYDDRERLENIFQKIKGRVGQSGIREEVTLGDVITLMRKKTSKKIHYIRFDSGTFFKDEKLQIAVPNRSYPLTFPTKRLVQVCFPCFPCQEIGLTDYRKYEDYRKCEDSIGPVFG